MKQPKVLNGRWSAFREIEDRREYNTFRVILLSRIYGWSKPVAFNHFHSTKVRLIKLRQQGFYYKNEILKQIKELRC